jgi:hypothetical protein
MNKRIFIVAILVVAILSAGCVKEVKVPSLLPTNITVPNVLPGNITVPNVLPSVNIPQFLPTPVAS